MPIARFRRHLVVRWIFWLGVLALLTALFLPVRGQIDKLNIALSFLLVVLGGSTMGGRSLGLVIAALAYLDFHYFFVERYDSLTMAKPSDWLVLVAFLTTSIVAEQLLTWALERAESARRRAEEVERLATLGAETLHAGRAEDALNRILEVIRIELRVDRAEILEPMASQHTAEPWPDARVYVLPLVVRGRTVGLLRLTHTTPIQLALGQRRFLDALSYYAALAFERVHLVAEAERAEAFRQADELKSAVVAALSHDLRTPLTTIKALASRLRTTAHPEAISIEEEADRLNRLVTDLLDLSRLNAKAMPIRLELNTAEDLIGAAMQRVAGAPGSERLVIVHPQHDDEPLTGEFDFVQSLRALVNLVDNALKYAPPGTPVEIGAVRTGAMLEFRVADRGHGVPEAERSRMFEPFYRPPRVAADTGGAGLGLAIASRLAAEQGGAVRYDDREGGGAIFTLALKAADVAV